MVVALSLEAAMARYPCAETYRFGDSAALSADLLTRVREGQKRATCSVAQLNAEQGNAMPVLGRVDIALNWDGTPALATRTAELRAVRYCDMTEEMALMEGENDTLAGWQADHRRYYERNGVFDPEMMLVWERFEIAEDFSQEATAVLDGVFHVSGRDGTVLTFQGLQGAVMVGDAVLHGDVHHRVAGIERIAAAPPRDSTGLLVEGDLKDLLTPHIGQTFHFARGPGVS